MTNVLRKHTEGPWEARENRTADIIQITARRFDGFKHFIIDVHGFENGIDDEARANASLIVAAPDLLEALEDMRTAFRAECNEDAFAALATKYADWFAKDDIAPTAKLMQLHASEIAFDVAAKARGQ
jgi:hypothetical protein